MFTQYVQAEKFTGNTQAMADKKANTWACKAAEANRVCLGDQPEELDWMCLHSEVSSPISISGHNPPYTVTIKGSQPPGLEMVSNETGTVVTWEGTPTNPGTFTVTLTATDKYGNSNKRDYVMRVIGITLPPGDLPPTLINTFYTALFTFGGPMEEPVVWSFGGLPPGITGNVLDGTLSGTPTVEGNYNIAISVTDANQRRCYGLYKLHVIDCATFIPPSMTLTVSCQAADILEEIAPSLCDQSFRIQSFGFRTGCCPGLCPDEPPEGNTGYCYNFGHVLTIEILDPDGNQFATYSAGAVNPFPTDVNQVLTIPAQPGLNPSPYKIHITISGDSASAPGWANVGAVVIQITGLP